MFREMSECVWHKFWHHIIGTPSLGDAMYHSRPVTLTVVDLVQRFLAFYVTWILIALWVRARNGNLS